jgi:hypothetical protein
MNIYPQTPPPIYGYESWQEELVLHTAGRTPVIQVRDVWNTTRFNARLRYDGRLPSVLAVESFWLQNRTAVFVFFDFDQGWGYDLLLHRNSSGAMIRTAPASTTAYALPAKNAESVVVRDDDVVVSPSAYTITPGAGFGGRDRLTFNTAPGTGSKLRVDLKGNRSYNARFVTGPRKQRLGPVREALTLSIVEDIEERTSAT